MASPVALGYGAALAWVGGDVLAAVREGEGRSPEKRCPSPQPRFQLWRQGPGGGPEGSLVADNAHLFEPVHARVSPDGAHVAVLGYCDQEFIGAVSVVSLQGAKEPVRPLPLGPDVAYGSPYMPATLEWVSPTELLVLRLTSTDKPDPDGLLREAVVVDVTTLRSRVLFGANDLVAVRKAGDGFLALSGPGYEMRIEHVAADGTRKRLATGLAAEVSPDAKWLATWAKPLHDDADPALELRPLAGGDATTVAVRGGLLYAAWSPRSDRLVAVTEDSAGDSDETTTRVYVVSADGKDVRELTLPGRVAGYVHWSPDGGRIAYTEGGDDRVRTVAV